jgi:hypothetical protein
VRSIKDECLDRMIFVDQANRMATPAGDFAHNADFSFGSTARAD